jgi:hypothetical protein
MSQILEAVIAFLNEQGWEYTQVEDRPIFKIDYKGESGPWVCYAHAREEDEQFLFYSVLEAAIPADKRPAMLEFIARANYGIAIGNFEMDLEDGEIRFKTSIDVEGYYLPVELIRQMVLSNVMSMDLFLPGIIEVVNKGTPPAEVIERLQEE